MLFSRREFVSSLMAAGISKGEKPNVLLIAVDDLNDWVGCLGGYPGVKTPNIDRIAGSGVLFTRAYCAAPVCNPSRASLLTGVRPSTSGVYENRQPFRLAAATKNAVTLPQLFTRKGYRSTGGGKIYHGAFPDPASWQDYFPSQQQNKPPDPVPANRPVNGIPRAAHFDWGPLDIPDSDMGDYKVATWAAAELSRKQDKPFFLACGMYRPHLPWYVPRRYFEMYPEESIKLPVVKDDDLDDVPPAGRRFAKPEGDHKRVLEHNQWRKAVQGYLASITFSDTCIGRVIDGLESGPNARNTIVILWSDHGWHLGEKLHWRKFALWEEATRNVLAISVPGVTKPGQRCARTVSSMDIFPTVASLCGLKPEKEPEGASLLPLLKNPEATWNRPALTTYTRGNHSVRSERWRYIRYADGSEELYDHNADELEWTNLASKPEFAGVKRELAKWMPKTDAEDSPMVKVSGEE